MGLLRRMFFWLTSRSAGHAGKPPVTWIGSPNYWSGRRGEKPIAIVYHIMDGTITGTDSWFRNPQSQVSAHFGVGKDGSIHQYVREEDTAWSNGVVDHPSWQLLKPDVNPNLYTLSIEHEGKPADGLTEAQYQASLALTRYLCARWGIPADRDHLIGHYRIDSVNRANCPGPHFPWDRLIADMNPVPAPPDCRVIVDAGGKTTEIPGTVREDGRAWAPVRAVAEALGATVTWDEATRTVRVQVGKL